MGFYRAYWRVTGTGAKSGRKRHKTYPGFDEHEARENAERDGTIVEQIEKIPTPPATERQKAFATQLGVTFPPVIDMDGIADLIAKALGNTCDYCATDETKFKAWRAGIPFDESISEGDLVELLDLHARAVKFGIRFDDPLTAEQLQRVPDLCIGMRWIYSVCRHIAKANWLTSADSGLDPSCVQHGAIELLLKTGLVEQIGDQEEGQSDEFDFAAMDAGIDECHDEDQVWFFFGQDGASTRIKAYKAVAEHVRVERR